MRNPLRKLLIFGIAALFAALICAPLARAAKQGVEIITPKQLEMFNKANELFEQENYQGIIALLQDEVEKSKKPHPYGCIMYGVAHLRLEKPAKAVEIFRKGLAASPDYAALHLNLGVAYVQQEKFVEAGDCFMQAYSLEAGSQTAPVYAYTASQCYYFAQKYQLSLETVKKALDHPGAKPNWVNLAGVNCLQLSRWNDAEQYFLRLVEMEPDKRQNWKSLAYSRLRMDRHNTATAALDIAARLPEVTERDHKELSGMYRYSQAPILGLEVEKLLPADQEQEKVYISSLLRANRQAKLIQYVDGLIAKKPSPELYLVKGTAHYRLGEFKSAQKAFNAGAGIKGKETERCNLLEGMVAWEVRDWESAKAAFAKLTTDDCKFKNQARQAITALEAMEEIEAEIAEIEEQLAHARSAENARESFSRGRPYELAGS